MLGWRSWDTSGVFQSQDRELRGRRSGDCGSAPKRRAGDGRDAQHLRKLKLTVNEWRRRRFQVPREIVRLSGDTFGSLDYSIEDGNTRRAPTSIEEER